MDIQMKRNCSIEEISDGKLYGEEDLVEASCNGCKGNSTCCHGMGISIILDPYDIYRLTTNLNKTFEELLADKVELNMIDGAILPNLKMVGETEGCAFLMDNGKCSIHEHRPGICRIFPLGRVYENNDFKYFLQVNECQNSSKTLSKISNWIDTPEPEQNKQFLIDWHYFLNDVESIVRSTQDEQLIKQLVMYILNQFYVKSFDKEASFYTQFNERFKKAKEIISTLRTAGRE
jgi:Predicted Fe-S-cluster oxidoreductase